MPDYAYTDMPLHGRFTDDGEYFRIYTDLNGVELWLLQLYVGDQREKFDEAAKNTPGATPSEST